MNADNQPKPLRANKSAAYVKKNMRSIQAQTLKWDEQLFHLLQAAATRANRSLPNFIFRVLEKTQYLWDKEDWDKIGVANGVLLPDRRCLQCIRGIN